MVGVKSDGTDFYSLGSNIFFLELASNMSFHKGCFSNSSISDQNDFEFSNWFRSLC